MNYDNDGSERVTADSNTLTGRGIAANNVCIFEMQCALKWVVVCSCCVVHACVSRSLYNRLKSSSLNAFH